MSSNIAASAAEAARRVAEFAARPYIQRALQAQPKSHSAVLSFFFGVDLDDPAMVEADLARGGCLARMGPLWFGGGPDYDRLCAAHFRDTVRAAGRGELRTVWPRTVDGRVAQLVCADQLSRNIFRGTPEAFAYDDAALGLARELTADFLADPEPAAPAVPGALHPPYCMFLVTSLMHSEALPDHDACGRVLDAAAARWPALAAHFAWQRDFAEDHRRVLERFGRYPHRNAAHGRSSTEEERRWLEDVEHLPGWAKSQV